MPPRACFDTSFTLGIHSPHPLHLHIVVIASLTCALPPPLHCMVPAFELILTVVYVTVRTQHSEPTTTRHPQAMANLAAETHPLAPVDVDPEKRMP